MKKERTSIDGFMPRRPEKHLGSSNKTTNELTSAGRQLNGGAGKSTRTLGGQQKVIVLNVLI